MIIVAKSPKNAALASLILGSTCLAAGPIYLLIGVSSSFGLTHYLWLLVVIIPAIIGLVNGREAVRNQSYRTVANIGLGIGVMAIMSTVIICYLIGLLANLS